MLAVVGNEAFGVEAGENGVTNPPPRLLDADEVGAGQHDGDHGQVLGIGREFRTESLAVEFAARAALNGTLRAVRSGLDVTKLLELGAIAVERRERILPQAGLDRRLRALQPLVGIALAQAHQVVGVLPQERGRQEQGHDAQRSDGK
jgi:hypothetical protein